MVPPATGLVVGVLDGRAGVIAWRAAVGTWFGRRGGASLGAAGGAVRVAVGVGRGVARTAAGRGGIARGVVSAA